METIKEIILFLLKNRYENGNNRILHLSTKERINLLKKLNTKCESNVYVDITQCNHLIVHIFFKPVATRYVDFYKKVEQTGMILPVRIIFCVFYYYLFF